MGAEGGSVIGWGGGWGGIVGDMQKEITEILTIMHYSRG